MRGGIKTILLAGLMTAAVLVLSGCSKLKVSFDPQDLYALPTLPAKYTELNLLIGDILAGGAEYAAPISGTNTQPVQLVDLDGDGQEEAVAFFRNSNEEKPLKIYIFTAAEDSYRQTDVIEGSGTSIYSVVYEDLDSDGRMEILVGWKTTDLQVLEVYSLPYNGAEVLVRSSYVKYATMDLNQDRMQELVVIRTNEEGEGLADYYAWQEDGSFTSRSSARISVTMAELSRVTQGTLAENVPALFVTGVSDATQTITDILAARNGELSNVVLSEVTGVSSLIAPYAALYPTDINGNALTEVPRPTLLYPLEGEDRFYQRVDWYSYNALGEETVECRTYHNIEDKWYFRLPEEWLDSIWITRSTTQDENTATFYRLDADSSVEPFLRITAITGSSREYRATKGTRFVLSRQSEVIYTAELLEANETWSAGMTADQVREAFSLIAAEWTAGDN